jgi:hypothetical protein
LLGSIYERHRLVALLDDSLGEFDTLAALLGDSQFCLNIGKIAGTTATDIVDLMVCDLSADTYVHGRP